MKVSFERKACKARLLSGTVNELMCVREEGECGLSAPASLSGRADQEARSNGISLMVLESDFHSAFSAECYFHALVFYTVVLAPQRFQRL